MRNKKIITYLFTAVFLVIAVLFVIYQSMQEVSGLISVRVTSNGESETINSWKNENDEYYIFLPGYADLLQVEIYANTENPIDINGVKITDGMTCDAFELDKPYDLTYTAWGRFYERSITFVKSGGVATMYIDTESGNMDYIHAKKGNEETGTIRLYKSNGETDYVGALESINGRGNYTWEFDKKPYSLKLSNEADLLGMGQAQKWILFANATDASNMRNKIIYDFANSVGLNYSPDSQWVDLYLNGEYAGLYLLCERNEVHPERADIKGSDSFLVSQELESRLETQDYTYVATDSGLALRVHYPLNASDEYLEKLDKTWQSVENAILADDGIDLTSGKSWQELIDIDSWARKYLIEEIFANGDASYISQYFYVSGETEKIVAGPVWDYDLSLGNNIEPQLMGYNALFACRPYVKADLETPWFYYLCQKEEFCNRVVELYQNEFLPLLNEAFSNGIDSYVTQIAQASLVNQMRWYDDSVSIFEEVNYIKEYMNYRISFLSSIWVENQEYNIVRIDGGYGANYAYYAVYPGECIAEYLTRFENTQTSTFLGWYYVDTDEPFDSTSPIYEDTEIYAKWQDSSKLQLERVIKLVPLAVIAVMFIWLSLVELNKIRKYR